MGIPLAYVQELAGYWQKSCDMWRELTTLAFLHGKNSHDQLATELRAVDSNITRARLVAGAIEASATITGRGPADDAAVDRMRLLMQDPKATLRRVTDYIGFSLSRL